MNKNHYLAVLVTVLFGVLLLIWASQDEKNKSVSAALVQGETRIDLKEFTSFDWTHVEVFGPYTTDDMIEDAMEIEFNFLFGGIDVLETEFLLVFANEQDPVKTISLSRKYGDYEIEGNRYLIVQ